ncbi:MULTISPECIES: SH3 domain-containing protein [unclassified Streptomyces]|uniref:SH3 domain-containing protein n=1 Tax=unclassified Streptomyces TaxID=2593676 RepID=UPI00202EFCC7|nr:MULTISPECIES: SH3 domain-containing protein [unclassified Streptomyces]MCM1976631.1 SH3 domain-containing protein [Streptomyces sp. G1]MCX5129277.1 SH3 domain-containing protein [Streptomyces sp. NBC_00347]
MNLRMKVAAAAIGIAAATGGMVLPATAVAAPSGATACSIPGWSVKDGSTGGTNSNAVNIRSGPSTGCTALGQAQMSHSLRYDCWVDGENGTWSHIRNYATGYQGWIKDSLLNGWGATSRC